MYSFFPETPKEAVCITQVSYMLHLFLTMKKSFYLYLLAVNEVFAYLPYPGLPNFRLLWPVILLSRKETIIPYMMVICIIVWYYKHWFTTNTDFQTQDSLLKKYTHSFCQWITVIQNATFLIFSYMRWYFNTIPSSRPLQLQHLVIIYSWLILLKICLWKKAPKNPKETKNTIWFNKNLNIFSS